MNRDIFKKFEETGEYEHMQNWNSRVAAATELVLIGLRIDDMVLNAQSDNVVTARAESAPIVHYKKFKYCRGNDRKELDVDLKFKK